MQTRTKERGERQMTINDTSRQDVSGSHKRSNSNATFRNEKNTVYIKNRTFKTEWTNAYSTCSFFLLQTQNQCVSYVQNPWHLLKVAMSNETKHKAFEQSYPPKSELSKQEQEFCDKIKQIPTVCQHQQPQREVKYLRMCYPSWKKPFIRHHVWAWLLMRPLI